MSDSNNTDKNTNDDESPLPFRRERNLSNRNFHKRGSRRCFSIESHSSVESLSLPTTPIAATTATTAATATPTTTTAASTSNITSSVHGTMKQRPTTLHSSSSSSSMQISYSVNSDTENAFNRKSVLKMLPPESDGGDEQKVHQDSPLSPDPALLDVKQKVKRFETFQIEERTIKKTVTKAKLRPVAANGVQHHISPLRVLPVLNRLRPIGSDATDSPLNSTTSSFHASIDEERSEDEVDEISDFEDDPSDSRPHSAHAGEYVLPEEAVELNEETVVSPLPGLEEDIGEIKNTVHEFGIDDFGKVESVRRSTSVESTSSQNTPNAEIQSHSSASAEAKINPSKRDFPRNYRSTPRPKTEIIGTKNHVVVGKYNSLTYPRKDKAPNDDSTSLREEEEEEPELRNKSIKVIEPILEELIKTEETYVEKLFSGIANYENIFLRRDLPVGLRGKKYVLFGNIEQLAEFHRDEFLPMLHRNRYDLKQLFEDFQNFIDQNCLYGYVIFTMNKQRSLKLCDAYKNYFKLIQTELDDKLGINSFLVQPIQRMARYPLLLQQFITTLFKHREVVNKSLIEACCRLEKKLRTLLTTTNESEVINDIVDCNEFNVFYQGKFRKVSEFQIIDYSLKRTYRGKVFIFDKCIIYTEIKGKSLVFHGRYPCEHIGIVAKVKNFTLFYERRKQQECDFHGDPVLVEQWLELIRDMVNSYVTEEKLKLQERYCRENDHLHRKPPSLSLFRDSNRFSSDSGIGNIWVMPKPEANEEIVNNRTTWYAVS